MAQVIAVAEIVRCRRCSRPLAENYGFLLLIIHHKRRMRFYGPGISVLDCPKCRVPTVVEVGLGC